ncbi:MAG: methyltransferase family protein [Candidatus Hermodarchaeota archaeon]
MENLSTFLFSPIGVIFAWIFFGVSHTFLASNWLKKRVPLSPQSYRRGFVTIAILWVSTLFAFSFYEVPTSILSVVVNADLLKIALAASSFIAGNLMFLWSFKTMGIEGLKEFAGLSKEKFSFIDTGVYAFCRHPLYTAAILLVSSVAIISLTPRVLSASGMVVLYFILGSIPEEKKLQKYIPQYVDYKRQVSKFFPWRPKHWRVFMNSRVKS